MNSTRTDYSAPRAEATKYTIYPTGYEQPRDRRVMTRRG